MSDNKQPSFLQSAKEGFGLAQRAIAAVFGTPGVKMVSREPTEYEQCLIEQRNIALCAHLLKKE